MTGLKSKKMKTGKIDINGFEVSGGDYVKFTTQHGDHEGMVYYCNKCCAFRIKTEERSFYLGGEAVTDVEVIKKAKRKTNPSV